MDIFFFLQTGHVIGNLFGSLEQFFHFQGKIRPFGGQDQLFVGTFEQFQPKLLFQLSDGS